MSQVSSGGQHTKTGWCGDLRDERFAEKVGNFMMEVSGGGVGRGDVKDGVQGPVYRSWEDWWWL
jgi:hypothetical protein